ncbi:hypothetical protein TNCV_599501 [Trichonephila clavipes]|nr:hypothetical protein TNCV_599501 [Trichonephila clavipes]
MMYDWLIAVKNMSIRDQKLKAEQLDIMEKLKKAQGELTLLMPCHVSNYTYNFKDKNPTQHLAETFIKPPIFTPPLEEFSELPPAPANNPILVPNSHLAASPLVRLVEGKKGGRPWSPPRVLSLKIGGTKLNHSVACMELKALANDRHYLALCHDEFHGP